MPVVRRQQTRRDSPSSNSRRMPSPASSTSSRSHAGKAGKRPVLVHLGDRQAPVPLAGPRGPAHDFARPAEPVLPAFAMVFVGGDEGDRPRRHCVGPISAPASGRGQQPAVSGAGAGSARRARPHPSTGRRRPSWPGPRAPDRRPAGGRRASVPARGPAVALVVAACPQPPLMRSRGSTTRALIALKRRTSAVEAVALADHDQACQRSGISTQARQRERTQMPRSPCARARRRARHRYRRTPAGGTSVSTVEHASSVTDADAGAGSVAPPSGGAVGDSGCSRACMDVSGSRARPRSRAPGARGLAVVSVRCPCAPRAWPEPASPRRAGRPAAGAPPATTMRSRFFSIVARPMPFTEASWSTLGTAPLALR